MSEPLVHPAVPSSYKKGKLEQRYSVPGYVCVLISGVNLIYKDTKDPNCAYLSLKGLRDNWLLVVTHGAQYARKSTVSH